LNPLEPSILDVCTATLDGVGEAVTPLSISFRVRGRTIHRFVVFRFVVFQ
jgi:hypothetical protein